VNLGSSGIVVVHRASQYKFIGKIELFIDGKSVISVDGLLLRDSRASYVQGIHFQTFFGGRPSGISVISLDYLALIAIFHRQLTGLGISERSEILVRQCVRRNPSSDAVNKQHETTRIACGLCP
jgi:hypothetical protein